MVDLLYECLHKIGDRDLKCYTFSGLNPGVLCSLNEPYKSRTKRSRCHGGCSASKRSLSPLPGINNRRSRKGAAFKTNVEAANMMRERNSIHNYNMQWDNRMTMEQIADKCEAKMCQLKAIYRVAKS
jgi:hypothetical protein